MECPVCKAKLASRRCNLCLRESPSEAVYCMFCGALLEETEGELDLEERILCPDGNCTGIIENGRCTVCGRPYEEKSCMS